MLFHSWEYFIYFLLKENQHSIHSPYFFNLYQDLKLTLRNNKRGNQAIEQHRKRFLSSREVIERIDYGAGSRWSNGGKQQVAAIAKNATSPVKYSFLYQFFCKLTPANSVLDLGTSLGLNTPYLASVTKGTLYTFEGDPVLRDLACSHLNRYTNIELVLGNLDKTLVNTLEDIQSVDFVLIDANHRYQPTIAYFTHIAPKLHTGSIVIIADIHWSKEMRNAWEAIKGMPIVTHSLDFFECGVLFFNNYGNIQDYILEI